MSRRFLDPFARLQRQPWNWTTLAFLVVCRLLQCNRAQAEDRISGKYENYHEEHNRVEVTTLGLWVEKALTATLTAQGEFVYDSISGATPTGGPPPLGSDQVPLAELSDIRRAGRVALTQRWGRHALTPQVAYSEESDYESLGVALNYALDFNEKNTTVTIGAARNYDRVLPGNSFLTETEDKDTLDLLLGITQLLDPKTVLTANLTLGFASGYLSDPYKGVRFEDYPFYEALFPENRPDQRDRQVGYLGVIRFFDALKASLEIGYRVSHDTYGIWSHTAEVTWLQKLGEHVVLSPFGRYYTQSAADFYGLSFPGDPSLSSEGVPTYYSSDYRLSQLATWTYGFKAVWRPREWLTLDAAFRRYEMSGNDGVTPGSAYPTANVFTVGAAVWF